MGQGQDSFGNLLVPVILEKLPTDVKRNMTLDHGNNIWQLQGGQSRDTHVVISHVLFSFFARFKVCFPIIFLFFGGFQKCHLVQSTRLGSSSLWRLSFRHKLYSSLKYRRKVVQC